MNANSAVIGAVSAGIVALGAVEAVQSFQSAHNAAELQHTPDATDAQQHSTERAVDGDMLFGIANLALGGTILAKGSSPAAKLVGAADTAVGALITGGSIAGWMTGSTAQENWERSS